MKNKYRNIFLLFGVAAIAVMLLTFDVSYDELTDSLRRAGIWFPVVVALWAFIYLLNAGAWYIIIHDGFRERIVPFWRVYKYTVTGFALNATTPVGLMGGEPYRIMELSPYVGVEKATSSVILYVMMHIFSHFCFWLFSILLYLVLYYNRLAVGISIFFALAGAFCLLGIYFFMKGYRSGLAMRCIRLLQKMPFLKKWAISFAERKQESLQQIDRQIAELHSKHRITFYSSLSAEFLARILSCAEIYFILQIFSGDVSYWDCILILAFTSLFANALFFLPMQLGGREGGFALAVGGLAMPYGYGVYMGLIMRIRELLWIVLGIALMKFGNRKLLPERKEQIVKE
ncbi:lysylphosphatidylglycerol synthase transmembrane domain-containing protein [Phocaeicola faecicola]|uniref:lysylphosphatidylglycerol synthase transmembrane domain-containing protein n=1 Tax=Phocaeicola faecicola TaxID=2739389 RepID=UPI0015E708AD|nr:lysylphosphatidylglycerol synthase transmembrane domain-containing protein [Phocaeicola faecicola]